MRIEHIVSDRIKKKEIMFKVQNESWFNNLEEFKKQLSKIVIKNMYLKFSIKPFALMFNERQGIVKIVFIEPQPYKIDLKKHINLKKRGKK